MQAHTHAPMQECTHARYWILYRVTKFSMYCICAHSSSTDKQHTLKNIQAHPYTYYNLIQHCRNHYGEPSADLAPCNSYVFVFFRNFHKNMCFTLTSNCFVKIGVIFPKWLSTHEWNFSPYVVPLLRQNSRNMSNKPVHCVCFTSAPCESIEKTSNKNLIDAISTGCIYRQACELLVPFD